VLVTDQAELVEVEYLSPEWYAARRDSIAASEIAAVLGLSPWVSPFDLWWLKRTGDDSQDESRGMKRGRRYEALILEDFGEEHPELYVAPSVTVRSIERPWQVATPDGLAYETTNGEIDSEDHPEPLAVIEAKTGQRREWGEPGTDEIPVHYRCQVLWQMDTLGLNVAYLPVLFGDQYAEYVVEYDEDDAKFMRERAASFLGSVTDDEMPEVDDSTATARRLKKLHPEVVEGDVEIPAYIIAQYHAAKRLRDAAAARMRLAENRIRMGLGPYNVGVCDGRKVASRSVYDVKPRVQEVRGFTVNKLHITTPKTQERNLSHVRNDSESR
jgi:putative phage-type endonuclease